jgi:hypothetical protein
MLILCGQDVTLFKLISPFKLKGQLFAKFYAASLLIANSRAEAVCDCEGPYNQKSDQPTALAYAPIDVG